MSATSHRRGSVDKAGASCLYCRGESLSVHHQGVTDRLRYVRGSWNFNRCEDCASLVLSPLPAPTETAAFYPPAYTFDISLGQESRKSLLAAIETHFFFNLIASWEADLVLKTTGHQKKARRTRVIDVGCGPGLRLKALHARGVSVLGADFSESAIEKLSAQHGMEGIVSDLISLKEKVAPQSADIVTAFDVIEHLPDLEESLHSCLALVKPGGWLVVGVPIADSLQAALFGKRWSALGEAPRHVSIPSRDGMKRLFRRLALEAISMHPYALPDCALSISASLFPTASTHYVYGSNPTWQSSLLRSIAGATTIFTLPFCAFENFVARRPGRAIFFGRKPPLHE